MNSTRMYKMGGCHFEIREGSTDQFVIGEVFNDQCYGSPESLWGCTTIVDVGANIGAFTIYAAYHTGARVIALEPEPENFVYLEQNVRLNTAATNLFDRIELRNLAVGAEGMTELFMPVGEGGNSAASIEATERYTQAIPCVTLESILNEIDGPISFLKMDIEGAETFVLEAVSDANMKRIQRFGMEYHGYNVEWGQMIRRLTQFHNLTLSAFSAEAHLYGGLCHGKLR